MASSCCSLSTWILLLLIVNLAVSQDSRNSTSFFEARKTERDALLNTGWWWWSYDVSSSTTSCDLIGVKCNEAGRVISIGVNFFQYYTNTYYTGIDLRKLNFSSFPYLQTLDLSYCELSGSIPYQIGMLSELKYLNLSTNHLTGDLPSSSGNLTQLQVLDVSRNELTGNLPSSLGNLTQLQVLDVSRNELTGNLPSSLGNLTQLQVLDVSRNELTGNLPSSLGNLSQLQVLDVSHNELTGNLPSSLGNLTQLQMLDVSYNELTGTIPLELGNLSHLVTLNLQGNNLHGFVPVELGDLSNLVVLDLSFNQFNGSLDVQLADLTQVTKLDVSQNSLTGSIPVFKNCSSLQYLDLSNNFLSGHIPEELKHCSSLEVVNFGNNNLTGSIPGKFLCSSSIYDLDLSYNNFSGSIPSTNLPVPNTHFTYYEREYFFCSKRKPHLSVLYIVLPLTIGLPLLILAFMFCCRNTPAKNQNNSNTRNGDICSIWSFDGHIAYEDIIRATNNFDIKYCIGTGGYGSVYEARLPSGKTVALKKLHRLEAEEPAFDRSFRNEVHVLSNIRHKNIVKLFGFCLHNRSMFLVYEFMEKGSLFCALRDDTYALELDWSKRVNIVKGIAHALSYMHHDCTPPIVHRDLSSNNILLDSEMEAFVADFGASRLLDPDSSNQTIVAGTCGYIAPGYLCSPCQKFPLPAFYVIAIYYYAEESVIIAFTFLILVALEIMMGSHPGDFLSSFTTPQSTQVRMLNDLLDTRLPRPTRQQELDIILVLKQSFACLSSNPKFRPSMKTLSQVFLQTPKMLTANSIYTTPFGQFR